MIYIVLIVLFILLSYFVFYYLDYKKKKKKILNLVDKKVSVIIGKSSLPDVKVNGILHYDNNYNYSNGNKDKKYFYIESKSFDFNNSKKIVVEQYCFSIFELKYIFLLSCNIEKQKKD